jgi:hypothetical protein
MVRKVAESKQGKDYPYLIFSSTGIYPDAINKRAEFIKY